MGKKRNSQKASTPTTETVASEQPVVDPTQAVETPEATETPEVTETPETPEVTPEVDVTPEVEEDTPEEDPADKQADPKVFWVEGFGNVNAKSQSEAEKKAKKILEDRRK